MVGGTRARTDSQEPKDCRFQWPACGRQGWTGPSGEMRSGKASLEGRPAEVETEAHEGFQGVGPAWLRLLSLAGGRGTGAERGAGWTGRGQFRQEEQEALRVPKDSGEVIQPCVPAACLTPAPPCPP